MLMNILFSFSGNWSLQMFKILFTKKRKWKIERKVKNQFVKTGTNFPIKIIYKGSANRLLISKNDRKMNRTKDIVSDGNEIKSVKKVQNLM